MVFLLGGEQPKIWLYNDAPSQCGQIIESMFPGMLVQGCNLQLSLLMEQFFLDFKFSESL